MKYFFICLMFFTTKVFSQKNKNKIENEFKKVDAVLLISHKLSKGVLVINDSTGVKSALPKLIVRKKLNYNIVEEKYMISGKSLDTLIEILNRPNETNYISQGLCFIPRHSIILLKKNTVYSYVDISFNCKQFETSKSLNSLGYFDDKKWNELEKFFLTHSLKQELSQGH